MEFNRKGFPIIRFHDDFFEIKAVDYWEFRSFMYSEVVAIDYYHNKDFWLPGTAMFAMASYDPYKLKIKKENGADWTYDTPRKFNEEFADVVKELLQRCGLERTK